MDAAKDTHIPRAFCCCCCCVPDPFLWWAWKRTKAAALHGTSVDIHQTVKEDELLVPCTQALSSLSHVWSMCLYIAGVLSCLWLSNRTMCADSRALNFTDLCAHTSNAMQHVIPVLTRYHRLSICNCLLVSAGNCATTGVTDRCLDSSCVKTTRTSVQPLQQPAAVYRTYK